ncbi:MULTISPECIES: DUF4149 domain-containing protein [unclassified Leptolyngbya]|uniref:DUF4149 domain-containing protein n=1 Tax=unclassified Leptolyngbya TaxID=2650499 RepID=UPI0016840F04|nr:MULTISPECIES: DUF4149 domain-containing protein [unclassified Leptolyngbya]MBD1912109.1 DUF4149 domain-containing protein [Leptolyngbya sp. FACHB-8]MBD2155000.1 DUF4149 domain-containing protein [Leptolyngbya sp. FACHB-16]
MRAINFANERRSWASVILFTLGLWLGGSLVVSLIVMPTLYVAGMMAESGFTSVGYSLFWVLNRTELLCASVVLTGVLVLAQNSIIHDGRRAIALATLLLTIPLLYTYILTPEMIALGAQLDLFSDRLSISPTMDWLHGGYWSMEILKFGLGLWLFRQIDQARTLPSS